MFKHMSNANFYTHQFSSAPSPSQYSSVYMHGHSLVTPHNGDEMPSPIPQR